LRTYETAARSPYVIISLPGLVDVVASIANQPTLDDVNVYEILEAFCHETMAAKNRNSVDHKKEGIIKALRGVGSQK
jgi:hypothetical protein